MSESERRWLLERLATRCNSEMRGRLKALVVDGDGGPPLASLRADQGRVGLESFLAESSRRSRS